MCCSHGCGVCMHARGTTTSVDGCGVCMLARGTTTSVDASPVRICPPSFLPPRAPVAYIGNTLTGYVSCASSAVRMQRQRMTDGVYANGSCWRMHVCVGRTPAPRHTHTPACTHAHTHRARHTLWRGWVNLPWRVPGRQNQRYTCICTCTVNRHTTCMYADMLGIVGHAYTVEGYNNAHMASRLHLATCYW